MKHLRSLATVEVSGLGHPMTFAFTRSFLADDFKGIRYRGTKFDASSWNKVTSNDTSSSTVFPNASSLSGEPESNQKDPDRFYSSRQSSIPSKKYVFSVSATLRALRGENPSSDSDLSSDSENSGDVACHFKSTSKSTPPLAAKTEIYSTSNNVLPKVESFGDDLQDLYAQLTKLGLPTSFGSTKKTVREVGDYPSDVDSSDLSDQSLLRCARKYFRSRYSERFRRSTRRRRRWSCSGLCSPYNPGHAYTVEDHMSSSNLLHSISCDHLDSYQRSVFTNLCNLLELACLFEQRGCLPFQMVSLHLPKAWTSRDFNLEAFLYSCKCYWRHEPSVAQQTPTRFSCATVNKAKLAVDLTDLESDPQLCKYWAQRFRLFSRFNEGIQTDRDGLFSATPEAIAHHQALRLKRSLTSKGLPVESLTVIDACSGTGANAIQLALVGFRVVAVEVDPIRVAMAAHNAEIYGVRSCIEFVCADFFDWARQELLRHSHGDLHTPRPYAALFMSPPWGGPAYLDSDVFDLNCIQFGPNCDANGCTFWFSVQLASQLTGGNVLLFLPRNSNMAQLPLLSQCVASSVLWSNQTNWCLEVEVNVLNAKFKAISIYSGSLCSPIYGSSGRSKTVEPSSVTYLAQSEDENEAVGLEEKEAEEEYFDGVEDHFIASDTDSSNDGYVTASDS